MNGQTLNTSMPLLKKDYQHPQINLRKQALNMAKQNIVGQQQQPPIQLQKK